MVENLINPIVTASPSARKAAKKSPQLLLTRHLFARTFPNSHGESPP